jgi:proline dehydrogenase
LPATRPLLQTALFPLAARFIAGESIEDVVAAVKGLNAAGLSATIDHLGEDVRDARGADLARDAYFALIERLTSERLITNLSLKLSALGLRLNDVSTLARFTSVLVRAQALTDPFVRVDMEGSALLPRTLETVVAAFAHHPNTGAVLQAYLHRTQSDLDAMIRLGIRVRLCKGAYREPPALALVKPAAIQSNDLACAMSLLRSGTYPAFATHDEYLIGAIRRSAMELGVAKTAFEFQMLYGVRPELQRSLAREGYSVRVYVPYGSHWAKYLRRRIMERRENAIFALRSALAPAWKAGSHA